MDLRERRGPAGRPPGGGRGRAALPRAPPGRERPGRDGAAAG
ncbi:hypothetical protein HMPREF0569_1911 [Micrococcus luteus SK58]|nr:hypothetical protein HMPREF0569_1911 [Micrococcus luteus SK58]